MSTIVTVEKVRTGSLPRNLVRALGVIGAALGAAAVWAIAVPGLGLHLAVKFGTGPSQAVGIDLVLISAVGGSLAGWTVLALLEWRTRRGLTIWTVLAVAGVILSLSAPLITGANLPTKITLPLMHLAVGAVLIPFMRISSRVRTV